MTHFTHPNGTRTRYPTTIDEAIELKSVLYSTQELCDVCNTLRSRHVCSDTCVYCAMKRALVFYNFHNKTEYILVDKDTNVHYSNSTAGGFEVIMPDDVEEMSRLSALVNEHPRLKVSTQPCKKAGHVGIRDGNKCYFCSMESSPRQTAIKNREATYVPLKHCSICNTLSPRKVFTKECVNCKETKPTSPRQIALDNGHTKYVSLTPCPACGTFSPKRVDNGRCDGCHAKSIVPLSPRQEAVKNGHTKYTPVRPCPKCNTLSPKRVDNGACDGCKPSKLSEADVALMRDCPDMILSKGDAKMMGLGVFKEEGHTGWRFVKGGKSI